MEIFIPFPRRAAALLTCAGLGLIAAAPGCVLTDRRPATPANPAAEAAGTLGLSSSSAATPTRTTDFRRDATPMQRFNVFMELARVHESQGNFEAAAAEYQHAAEVASQRGSILAGQKLGPTEHALAQRRLAAALDRMGRFTQAETHYQQAMKLAPNDARVWNDLGYSYYLQSRWPDAERTLKTADAMEPNNPRVLTNLGLTLAAQGRDDEALMALTKASGPAVGHANLGFLLAAMGKRAEARVHYETAVQIQPELAAAKAALAQLDKTPPPSNAALASAAAPPPPAAAGPQGNWSLQVSPANPTTADASISRASTTR
jgi:Flp pilus assembly protein TadD